MINNNRNKYGLTERDMKTLEGIFLKYPEVREVRLFGSRAKGHFKHGSDIDLAVMDKEIDSKTISNLSFDFEESSLPYTVDLINFPILKHQEFIEHIDRIGIVFYERWKKHKFSDFVEINPTVKFDSKERVSFIEMKDLNDGFRNCYPSIERKLTGGARFENDDTLFARITPCLENGKICQVKGLKDGVGLGSTEFLVFRGRKGVSDNDFIFYLSRWDGVRDFAENHFEGTSGRQRVPKDCFNSLLLNLPPFEEQVSIASTLSSLDDKIDLLQRQNKTLEQLAETLFRQWFVEEANEDWEETTLYDAIILVGGGTPKTNVAEYWDGKIKWLSGGDIASNHKSFIMTTEKTISDKGLNNSSSKLLPKYATVISARGTVGKYCLLSEPMAFSQSNYGIKPKYEDCYFFTYLLIAYSVDELQSSAYGSVFDTITTKTFQEQLLILPEYQIIKQFEKEITSYFEKMLNNQNQILTLTQLRDALLPKLVSGEARVKM